MVKVAQILRPLAEIQTQRDSGCTVSSVRSRIEGHRTVGIPMASSAVMLSMWPANPPHRKGRVAEVHAHAPRRRRWPSHAVLSGRVEIPPRTGIQFRPPHLAPVDDLNPFRSSNEGHPMPHRFSRPR